VGSRVSRDALDQSDDSDVPQGQDDEDEEDTDMDDFGSEEEATTANIDGEEDTEIDQDSQQSDGAFDSEKSESDAEDMSEASDSNEEPMRRNGLAGQIDTAELRKLTSEAQKHVASSLTQGAKTEAEKGKAVKAQRSAFDALLNIRIKLQKALISMNSIPEPLDAGQDEDMDAMRGAEEAAMTLWNNLQSLQSYLHENRTGQKRKFSKLTDESSFSATWEETKSYEADAKRQRNARLDWWSSRSQSVTARNQRQGLNSSNVQHSLSDVLGSQLMDMDRLVAKTKVPRSCAPNQAATFKNSGQVEAGELGIFDDADFYGTLLQSLITQRGADTAALSALNVSFPSQPWQAAREARTKKPVDTRASKGRKLRYNVHEKLQNFMAPEDRTSWEQRQCDEFFGSLFGKTLELAENSDAEGDDLANTEGLRLFA
jgi:protein AATF/BFR2